MKENEKNQDRKQERRQKLDKSRKKQSFYNEEDIVNNKLKKEFKKTKERFEDEEWEDWDKYYNR